MLNESDQSVRNKEYVSHFEVENYIKEGLEEYVNADVESELLGEEFNKLQIHLQYLTSDYKQLKDFISNFKNESESQETFTEEDILSKLSSLNQILLKEIVRNKSQLADLQKINLNLVEDLEKCNQKLIEKESLLSILNDELEYVKGERDENIFQLKSILKDFDLFTKIPVKTSPTHFSHAAYKRESITSIGTYSTTNTHLKGNQNNIVTPNLNDVSFEVDKLTKEKTSLENQLVLYKFKFAEQSSKIMEIEDEKESYKKKYENYFEKVKLKDEIIKNLISERDNLKYRKMGTLTAGSGGISLKSSENNIKHSENAITNNKIPTPSTKKKNRFDQENNYLNTDIDFTHDTGYINSTDQYLHTDKGPNSNSKNPSSKGFVKILKNIFIHDKK